MANFKPDVDYVKFAYLDRRDFVNQLQNVERVPDSELEGEFEGWLKDVQAQAWLKGYLRGYEVHAVKVREAQETKE